MAQQKMQCALQRTSSNIENVSNGGSSSSSRKSLEQNTYSASKDHELSAILWRNYDQRYVILRFITFQPELHWKLLEPVSSSLHSPENRNHLASGPKVNMGILDLVSPLPVDARKTQNVHPPDCTCSVKPFSGSYLSGRNLLQQSRNRGFGNRRLKFSKACGRCTQQNFNISSNSSGLIQNDSNAASSADPVKDQSKLPKPAKRNSRKKARKKGKRNKKPAFSNDYTELKAFSDEVLCSSSFDSLSKNDMNCGEEPLFESTLSMNATVQTVLSQEGTARRNDCDDITNGTIDHSEILMTSTTCNDKMDRSEAEVAPVIQNSSIQHLLTNFENGAQIQDSVLSTSNSGVEDSHLKLTTYFDDISSEVYSDANSAPVLDFVSDDCNSDVSSNSGGDVKEKSCFQEDNGINHSELPVYNARRGWSSCGKIPNGVDDSWSNMEGTKCGIQECCSSGMDFVLSGKRGRQDRKLIKNSSVNRFNCGGNLNGRTGKENNHSVWQKVQRKISSEYNCDEMNQIPVGSQLHIALKEAPVHKRACNFVDNDALLKPEDENILKFKASGKQKRKPITSSKYDYSCNSRNRSHVSNSITKRGTKIHIQLKEAPDIPPQVICHNGFDKGLDNISTSPCYTDCSGVGFQTDKVDCSTSELVQASPFFLDELEPPSSVCTSVSSYNDQSEESQNNSSFKCDSLGQPNLIEVQSPVVLRSPVGNGPARIDKGDRNSEYSKQDGNPGPMLQKWMPVGRKYADSSRSENLSMSHHDDSIADRSALKNVGDEKLSSNAHGFISEMDVGVLHKTLSSVNLNGSQTDNEGQIQKLRTSTHDAVEYSTFESKNQNNSISETDSDKIAKAVSNAYRMQLASEGIQLATGSPLAEFERFLNSASPILCGAPSVWHCPTCLQDQLNGAPLCRHERLNVSLESLWQWYEKHCSYGLEVRVEDYQNSRSGIDRFEFRAYFVPFLSAIQLFRSHSGHPMNNRNGNHSSKVLMENEKDEASEKSSSIARLPIFSILVPKPRREEDARSSQFLGTSSSSVNDEVTDHSSSTACSNDPELIFEYFESEPPQQRRPLFEKMKDLARGDRTLSCQTSGDGTKLDSLNLRDLHPSSWYSVAWYPIYRIPDGSFRAAFLTYHSLGHLTCRSGSSDSLSGNSFIVSPVVGLQSYNAQSECWFQPKFSVVSGKEGSSSFDPSEIMKEQLKTLEQTASVMARAIINRENLRSVNRQPDYEFFVSRSR